MHNELRYVVQIFHAPNLDIASPLRRFLKRFYFGTDFMFEPISSLQLHLAVFFRRFSLKVTKSSVASAVVSTLQLLTCKILSVPQAILAQLVVAAPHSGDVAWV